DQPSRALVDTAIAALSRMTHRGGVAADGLTGDGCGLLLRKPEAFLRALAGEAGITIGAQARFAAGLVFLPRDPAAAARCREALKEELARVGTLARGWRVPPIDESVCGELARATLPRIEQVFVEAGVGQDEDGFGLALFLARRRAEQRIARLATEHGAQAASTGDGLHAAGNDDDAGATVEVAGAADYADFY